MKRRDFLQKLGIGAAACAVVPLIYNTHEEPFTVEKLNDACEEIGVGYDLQSMGFIFPDIHSHAEFLCRQDVEMKLLIGNM